MDLLVGFAADFWAWLADFGGGRAPADFCFRLADFLADFFGGFFFCILNAHQRQGWRHQIHCKFGKKAIKIKKSKKKKKKIPRKSSLLKWQPNRTVLLFQDTRD